MAEDTIKIRSNPFSARWTLGGGLLLCGLVVAIGVFAWRTGVWDWPVALMAVAFLGLGLWMTRAGIEGAADRGVKLTVTPEGITDHRSGVSVTWREFRGVRLNVATTNGSLDSATMLVLTDGGEVAFDVADLDRHHESIADLVHRRGLQAVAGYHHFPPATSSPSTSDPVSPAAAAHAPGRA